MMSRFASLLVSPPNHLRLCRPSSNFGLSAARLQNSSTIQYSTICRRVQFSKPAWLGLRKGWLIGYRRAVPRTKKLLKTGTSQPGTNQRVICMMCNIRHVVTIRSRVTAQNRIFSTTFHPTNGRKNLIKKKDVKNRINDGISTCSSLHSRTMSNQMRPD